MGVRVIIRDDKGNVVAAQSKVIPFITDPTSAEALAAWHAILLAREVGGKRVLLEGDSAEVVYALSGEGPCYRLYGQLIEDTKIYLAYFTSIKVMHVQRNANKATHVLAKCAISQLLDKVWIQECHSYITDVVLAYNVGNF
jgi:ribonuclease HI